MKKKYLKKKIEEDHSELEEELEEAYSTIKELQSTINEVNLLNAKLLYANKLFRGYSLTNEQKAKVVENLDRTSSVREVKLVYATLAESMNFTGTEKKAKRAISESVVSKATKSTAPVKEVITESADALAERFKKLANIK
jgi:CHASE3 domain sensor protein